MATFTRKPWDGSAARWKNDAVWCQDCLIDENAPGKPKVKTLCKLPYREPDGEVNVNALHAAAAALAGGRTPLQATAQSKRAAARKLKALYAELKEPCPPMIAKMAL